MSTLLFFCFLTRLPQLLSPHLLLDGDECVTAIMAKYLMLAKDYSLFFWGQQYGFTIIESIFIVPFYLLFGINAISVKLAMLSLWTIGVIFLYKCLIQFSNKQYLFSFLLTIFFISMPAWATWSMKARGGYLTAFTLGNIFIYMLFNEQLNKTYFSWILYGLLIEIIYECQPLWLIGLVPLVLFVVIEKRSFIKFVLMLVFAAISFFLFKVYKSELSNNYVPDFNLEKMQLSWANATIFHHYLFRSLTGYYYFNFYQTPDTFSSICAYLIIGLILFLMAVGIYFVFKRKENSFLFICSTLFLYGYFLIALFFPTQQGRYLLPISGFALISLCIALKDFNKNRAFYYSGFFTVFLGLVSLLPFWSFEFIPNRKKEVENVIKILNKNKIYNTFSIDCMFPWQIIFYSDEKIISVIPYYCGRYKPYYDVVEYNWNQNKKVAIIDYRNDSNQIDNIKYVKSTEFCINITPSKEEILKDFFKK